MRCAVAPYRESEEHIDWDNMKIVMFIILIALEGCALRLEGEKVENTTRLPFKNAEPASFSDNLAGHLPNGWDPLIMLRHKNLTHYQLIEENKGTVLHARADNSSSGLMHYVDIEPAVRPWLHWRWKIAELVENADNTQRSTEDSPVRIILGFDGNKDALPFTDQLMFETAKAVTGYDFPYATLMYIWENKVPVGTVIPNSRSNRIQMIVAASGAEGVGRWRDFTRNIIDDYEKAFGGKPGRLIGVGVLTDTDNTGDSVEAWYGDIRLLSDEKLAGSGGQP